MAIPKPTELRISTHTATCNINSLINVKIIADKLNISDKIVYIEYGNKTKGTNPKNISKKAKKKKKVFFNQITIIVRPSENRLNNVKLFNNGAVSMTGLKALEEGQISINIILDLIKDIKGVLYEQLNDDNNELNNKTLKCVECDKICSFYTLNKIKCGDYVCNLCKENFKFCKKCNVNCEENAVINRNICKIKDYKIVLINSDFYVGFEIDRSKLHSLLIEKYNIFSTFEPCIYPGVNSKYFWNEDYKDYQFQGKCYCDTYCSGKGCGKGNGNCKKITISMFQSGSVIITGARNIEQINIAYNFVNKIFSENYEQIKKNSLSIFNDVSVKKIVKIKKK